jgi:hypothetical protein
MAEDAPLDFFDLSWLAVKGGEPEAIAGVLELSGPVAATWTQGIHAVAGDFWDFKEDLDCHDSRVFVAPLVDGWRLVVGGWFGGMGDKDPRAIAECCRLLSERYGAAHAFTTQGRMGLYAWTLALSGGLQRLFVFDNGPIVGEGTPPEIELQLKQAELANGDGDLWPSEEAVMGIARAFSIAPADLGPHQQSVGQGLMFTTAWGRTHGTPERPLCNCRGKETSCG